MHDLNALRTFHKVAQLGGVGAAARAMKVSQPAVSQRLRALERQCGRKLYGLAGRRLVLSEEGRRLFEACRQAFDVLESAESALLGLEAAPLVGTVRIAALSEIAKVFLLPGVRAFRALHPAVGFDILYTRPYEVLAALSRDEADFGLTNEAYRRPQLALVRAFVEKVVCVGPGPARRLALSELERLPWMTYGSDDPLWSEFQEAAARRGLRLGAAALKIADVESLLRLAADGVGYALAPAHAVALRGLKGLAVHALPLPPIRKQIYLCRLKSAPLNRASAAFWDYLLARCKERGKKAFA